MNKKKIYYLVMIIIIIVIIFGVLYFSFAYYSGQFTGIRETGISTDVLNMTFTSESAIIVSGLPMNKATALSSQTPYTFTLNNTSNFSVTYNLKVIDNCTEECNCTTGYVLADDKIAYYLNNNTTNTFFEGNNPKNNLINSTVTLAAKTSNTFNLYMWIDETATADDIYIKNNNDFLIDSSGYYIAKNYCVKLIAIGEQVH